MNALSPGIIPKINVTGGDYKMMDNLSQLQKACLKYGVPDLDLFQATDLWDFKNISLVTQSIFGIARAVSYLKLYYCLIKLMIFIFPFRHTDILNSKDHSSVHVQLKKIVENSPKRY